MQQTENSTAFFFDDAADTQAFDIEAVVINDFLRQRSEDRARGAEGDLAHYQQLFSGFETLVEREWDVEHRTESMTIERLRSVSVDFGHPKTIGRYEIWGLLGQGGMGRVYRAFDPRLRRDVVVKTLRAEIAHDPEMRERFEREARATSNIHHDGICPALDFFEEDGSYYAVLGFVDGRPLNEIVRDARRSTHATPSSRVAAVLGGREGDDDSTVTGKTRLLDRRPGPVACAHLIERLARAVHVAHENRIVHRDIKPGNVVVRRDGAPVILDFGLARDFGEGASDLTTAGDVLGTPSYMAPEQARGDRDAIGPATDVYALGIVLFQLLTLELPFETHDRRLMREMILHAEPSRLRSIDPSIPRDLEAVCHKAFERDPERRYASALELADDLARFRRLEPVLASRVTSLGRFVRVVRRDPRLVALAIVSVLAVVAMWTWGWSDKRDAVTELRENQERIEGIRDGTLEEAERRRFLALAESEGYGDVARRLLADPTDAEAFAALRDMTFERAMRGDGDHRLIEPRFGVADPQPVLRFRDWVSERADGRELAYAVRIMSLERFDEEPITFIASAPTIVDDVVIVPLRESVKLAPGPWMWSVEPVVVRRHGAPRSLGVRRAEQYFRVIDPRKRDAALAGCADVPAHLRAHDEALALLELGLLAEALAVLGEELPPKDLDPSSMKTHARRRVIALIGERLARMSTD